MKPDRIGAIATLLAATEAAHGEFETTELHGVYDEEWPRWYAEYAVDHGIAALVGHAVTSGELAQVLARVWDEFQRADPVPTEPWATYTARRIAVEL